MEITTQTMATAPLLLQIILKSSLDKWDKNISGYYEIMEYLFDFMNSF